MSANKQVFNYCITFSKVLSIRIPILKSTLQKLRKLWRHNFLCFWQFEARKVTRSCELGHITKTIKTFLFLKIENYSLYVFCLSFYEKHSAVFHFAVEQFLFFSKKMCFGGGGKYKKNLNRRNSNNVRVFKVVLKSLSGHFTYKNWVWINYNLK